MGKDTFILICVIRTIKKKLLTGPWSDIVCHIAVSASVFMTMSITLER